MRFERCGKIVVATSAEEVPRLDELERRGRANGLEGVRRIGVEELREHEPHAAGVAALFVPGDGDRRLQGGGASLRARARAPGRRAANGRAGDGDHAA